MLLKNEKSAQIIILGQPIMQTLPADIITVISELIDLRNFASVSTAINTAARRSESYRFFTTYKLTEKNLGQYGTLDIIKYVSSEHRITITANLMDYAAASGHLRVVQWLHENRSEGCTWAAMTYVAKEGHLHVIQWLHENRTEGCTIWAMDRATEKGHHHVVQYLKEHDPHLAT